MGATSRGVDGTVDIVIVDLDLEGDVLTSDEIDGKLETERHEGVASDFEAAIDGAREGLGKFLDDEEEMTP